MKRRRDLLVKYIYSVPYSISYNLNGGSVAIANPDSYCIDSSEFTLNNPTKSACVFLGWTQDSGNDYVTDSKFGTYGNRTYTAHWLEPTLSDNITNFDVVNLPDNDGDGVFDEMLIEFTGGGYYEFINIPITNLVAGQAYKLTLHEKNNAVLGNYNGAMYGSLVLESENTEISKDYRTESQEQGGCVVYSQNNNSTPIWIYPDTGTGRDISITFTAENSTMYWIWCYGFIKDNNHYNYEYTTIKLRMIIPEINLADYTLRCGDNGALYTVNYVDDRKLNFTFVGGNGTEDVSYKISNLQVGSTYTITFGYSYNLTKGFVDSDDYDFGCAITDDTLPNSNTIYKRISWHGDRILSNIVKFSGEINVPTSGSGARTLTFTATTETGYWLWNLSDLGDGKPTTVEFNIINFSVHHPQGGEVTYI